MYTMGLPHMNKVARLKNGNFIIKFEYQYLKIYWNLTKERIEKVFRIDYPSEIPPLLVGNSLFTTPNINHIKKHFMCKFNLETATTQMNFLNFFKKYTRNFTKKFERIKYIPGTSKVYFEGSRQVDELIYNRDTVFVKSQDYDKLYNTLQCIDYDFLTNRCIIYELPCVKEDGFELLGFDLCSELSYIVTCDQVIYKLDSKYEQASVQEIRTEDF